MEIERDFKELLELFNSHKVEYILVGAHALAFHGAPRFTGDLDLFVKQHEDNARRIMTALSEFGFGALGLSVEDFEKPDQVIQLGVPPVRIDLMTSISGVTWEKALDGSIPSKIDGVPVRFIGKEELIINKRAAGRKKDLADIDALGEE